MRCLLLSFSLCVAVLAAPWAWSQDETFSFRVSDAHVDFNPDDGVATFESTISIAESTDRTDFPSETAGFQMGIAHDGTLLEVLEAIPLNDLADLDDGDGPGFYGPDYDPDNGSGIIIGVVYSLLANETITFDVEKDVIELTYRTIPAALTGMEIPTTTPLTWSDDLGDPRIANSMVVEGQTASVTPIDGEVLLNPVRKRFLRGDANGNGRVFGILDALFLLEWAFAGGPEPDCFDAADADDNGSISAILDAKFVLEYSFIFGPTPPAPGPDTCGEDPTDDSLECETPLSDC